MSDFLRNCPKSEMPCRNAARVYRHLEREVFLGRLSSTALIPIFSVAMQCEGDPRNCPIVAEETLDGITSQFKEAMSGENPPPDERAFELKLKAADPVDRALIWINLLPVALLEEQQDGDTRELERIKYALGEYYNGKLSNFAETTERDMFMSLTEVSRTFFNTATSEEQLYSMTEDMSNRFAAQYIIPNDPNA